ncbi:MAG: dihydrofolate reductase [Sphingopyxis sp.]|uniref:dihydrofolate reductase n=1 Tax=Sphingopyxis sp. TaxID=1908224 RepID=UPI002AB888BC|nr:dihydrofolate reductase [Sphingopyxis sp.]MDZ3830741.1 dihydrofolate reductase [Sphingopyxis sp.]
MNRPDITLILARAANGIIGADGKMPWHIPADLRRFKQLTMGRPMIMGRKTYDSLPAVLEGRRHIVLTRDPEWEGEDAEPVASVEEALRLANAPQAMVIGGGEIYRLFLPLATRIELTEVALEPAGDASIAYPDASQWRETAREDHAAAEGRPAYSFVTFTRKS